MSDSVDGGRWHRIASLLDALLDLPEAERPARLAALCEDDAGLRAEIEELLRQEGRRGLLDQSVDSYLATLLAEGDAERGRLHGAPPESPAGAGSAAGSGADSAGSPGSGTGGARFLPGALLAGRYRIVSRLGRGGMGEVYRADDLKLGQAVALKFVSQELSGSEAVRSRFLTEIKLARRVAHPNVCRVYDLGEAEDQLFLSMEFVEGEDLASLLKRIGRLPREKAVQIAQQLCAGLAAAHAEGILHRDLKPANVMLDERGRVRITDFGVAGVAEELDGEGGLAGTPAYMSPEQLAGEGASIRSDVYALGLVLYELFTGRRAFEGRTWEELRRARHSAPSTPSSHVAGIDPAVERVILRCLEEDPVGRPGSALEVAGALPGGDPLAAALAAGETPSPELVAAAGPSGRLRAETAGALLAGTALLLGIAAWLAPGASYVGIVPMDKPVAALVDDAREILADLGYNEPPADHAYWLSRDLDYVAYLDATDRGPTRWRPLASRGQMALGFEYRQGPRPLAPLGWTGQVTAEDPPPGEGDVAVVTDLRGRLRALRAVPPAVAGNGLPPVFAGWQALFAAAGLDPGAFEPTAPIRQPPVFAERRAAWLGTLPELDLPVRIEAAAAGSKPVHFELILPSSPHWVEPGSEGGVEPEVPRTVGFFSLLWLAFQLLTFVLPVVLALRNLRLGRGDRRGAYRLAAAVFALRIAWWLLAGHHVADLWVETSLLGGALARAAFVAAAAWVLYLAIEPHARRLWPGTLISWTRLLAGRVRDPLVGQHLLLGALAGVAIAVFGGQLYFLIPDWLGWPNPPWLPGYPFWPFFAPRVDPLLGTRAALAAVASTAMGALWALFAFLTLLVGLFVLLRRKWLAVPVFVLLMAFLLWPAGLSGQSWLGVTTGMLIAVLWAWLLVRFGLLCIATAVFTVTAFFVFPITFDPAAPYFGTSLFALLIVAAVAGLGAWTAASGLPGAARAVHE